MKIDLTPTDVAIVMEALATRRQRISQWIDDMKAKNEGIGDFRESEYKISLIDKAWRKLNEADMKDMQKAKDEYMRSMEDDLDKHMEEAQKAFHLDE